MNFERLARELLKGFSLEARLTLYDWRRKEPVSVAGELNLVKQVRNEKTFYNLYFSWPIEDRKPTGLIEVLVPVVEKDIKGQIILCRVPLGDLICEALRTTYHMLSEEMYASDVREVVGKFGRGKNYLGLIKFAIVERAETGKMETEYIFDDVSFLFSLLSEFIRKGIDGESIVPFSTKVTEADNLRNEIQNIIKGANP